MLPLRVSNFLSASCAMFHFLTEPCKTKLSLNQPGFSEPLIWHFFFLRTHKKLKPKCATDLPCALKLDPPRTYISQMRNQTPLSPQFTQVLMYTQDYISSLLSPSSSWFLPRCTAPSTSLDPGLHFWLLSRRLPLTEPAVISSNSYRDH